MKIVQLPLRKLLIEYFEKWELENLLSEIDESTSGIKNELVSRLIHEWENHGRSNYEFFHYLDKPRLSRICKAYQIDHIGSKDVLLKRIKKAKLLEINAQKDNSHLRRNIAIMIGIIAALITIGEFVFDAFQYVKGFLGL